jgi:putative hydrolase of the HAD superfamily
MKIILWDFDGTLAYREGMWSGTIYTVLEKNNIRNISAEEIKPYLSTGFTWHTPEYSHKELFGGKTWWGYYENYFYNIFIKLGLDKEDGEKLSKQIKWEYMDKTKWNIYNDVTETLEKLIAKGYKNVILSNHIPELNEIVNNIGLEKYFIRTFSSGKIGYEKPNRKIYKYVFCELGLDKKDYMMIGDSYESDIKGGIGVGIKSILVRKENKNEYKWHCKDLKNIMETIEEIEK